MSTRLREGESNHKDESVYLNDLEEKKTQKNKTKKNILLLWIASVDVYVGKEINILSCF